MPSLVYQEVYQRRHGERLCKNIAKHVILTGRTLGYGSWWMEGADKDGMMIRMVGG